MHPISRANLPKEAPKSSKSDKRPRPQRKDAVYAQAAGRPLATR